jgi:GAF domain-containing protein
VKEIHRSIAVDGNIDAILETSVNLLKKTLMTEKVSVMISSKSKSKYYVGRNMQIDHQSDPTRGIAKLCAENRKMVIISDCESVPRFNMRLSAADDGEHLSSIVNTKNIICSPIVVDDKLIGIVYALDINPVFLEEGSDHSHAVQIFEVVVDHMTTALRNSFLLSKSILENKRSSALLSILRMRSSDGTLDKLLQVAIEAVDMVVSPQLVSIYLCDQSRREIFVCASKDGMEGLTISYGQGVAGYVAATMESVRIDDAYSDSRFLPTVDKFTGSVTHSIICVPVPGFANSSPIALIQVINQTMNSNFDEDDEDSLKALAEELSIGLRMRAKELYALKTLGQRSFEDVSLSILEESLLQDYGSIAHRYKYRVVGDKIILGPVSPLETTPNSRRAMNGLGQSRDQEVEITVGRFTADEASSAISTYSYDPFVQSDDDLIDLAVHMFRCYNLLETMHIDAAILHKCIVAVHSLYHPSNAFHNFKHGWSVMHLSYQILRAGADQLLTSLDITALLIAAICHDVDHTGYSNNFEIASRSPLAMLYCDDTVLERHHAATTNRILSSKEFDFLPYMNANDKKTFRKTVTAAIFATDMSKHFDCVERLMAHTVSDPPFDKSDPESRLELVRYILHSADIGAQTQDSVLSLQWTEKCIAEFSHQADKEIELGLDPTPYMVGLKADELKCMQLQHGFISGIVLPLWSSLAECFPNLSPSIDRLLANKQYFGDRIDQLKDRSNASSPAHTNPGLSTSPLQMHSIRTSLDG